MPAESKITMTRVIVGVASVGATLALVYLYNKYQERKSKRGIGGSSRVRRQSSKSGEVKKVTFKEAADEERDSLTVHEPPMLAESKLLENSVEEGRPVVGLHEDSISKEDNVFSSIVNGTKVDHADSRCSPNTTNNYENNSTLKLDDSRIRDTPKSNNSTTTPVQVVKRPVEEVISRSKGPLMTSTPLPGRDGGQVGLRQQSANFEAHRSDIKSSAQGTSTAAALDADCDTFTFRKEMRIPRETVAALIGKKGCNIKGIQAQSGTTINFHDTSKWCLEDFPSWKHFEPAGIVFNIRFFCFSVGKWRPYLCH